MPAYLHADIEVLGLVLYDEYHLQVRPIAERHGGRSA
jgi:uncharacterized protein (DUF1330 family)